MSTTSATTDAPQAAERAPTTDTPATTASTTGDDADDQDAAGNGDVQYESLSAWPWASPDDAHETPEAAVEAFLEFATSGLFERDGVAIGGYRKGDARSGEATVQFVEQFGDTTRSASVLPVITVLVRQASPRTTGGSSPP